MITLYSEDRGAANQANPEEGGRVPENGQPAGPAPAASGSSADLAVTMVQWSADDKCVITAVADNSLRVWDPNTGQLLSRLVGHTSLVYTLEPHPLSGNIILSAGHDGQLMIWDLTLKKSLFGFKNEIVGQGHAPVFGKSKFILFL